MQVKATETARVTRGDFISIISTKNRRDKASQAFVFWARQKQLATREGYYFNTVVKCLCEIGFSALLKYSVLLCWCGMLKFE